MSLYNNDFAAWLGLCGCVRMVMDALAGSICGCGLCAGRNDLLIVLLCWRMCANVFEGTQHIGRHGWWCGQMITHGMVTLLVGGVAQWDLLALGRHVGHSATHSRWIARLLDLYAVACLIGKLVIALRIGCIVLEAAYLCVLVDVVGAGAANESKTQQLQWKCQLANESWATLEGHLHIWTCWEWWLLNVSWKECWKEDAWVATDCHGPARCGFYMAWIRSALLWGKRVLIGFPLLIAAIGNYMSQEGSNG